MTQANNRILLALEGIHIVQDSLEVSLFVVSDDVAKLQGLDVEALRLAVQNHLRSVHRVKVPERIKGNQISRPEPTEEQRPVWEKLDLPFEELLRKAFPAERVTRLVSCLEEAAKYPSDFLIGHVVTLFLAVSETLPKIRGFGDVFQHRTAAVLESLGLKLGMKEEELLGWTPPLC
jgi:hypothetical protein